jgi:putative ABC transport system permease protein
MGNSREHRERRNTLWVESTLQDLCFALRQLRNSSGFAVAAVLTLGLGIGANTAVFSVIDAVMLRPLPYEAPTRLVWPTFRFPKMNMHTSFVPHPVYFAWREENHVFSGVAATHFGGNETLTGAGFPDRIPAMSVSANFFSILGTNLALGRSFTSDEDRPEGPRVAILNHALWKSRFAGNPKILGQLITLNSEDYSIVGVLPADFKCPTSATEPQVFTPLDAPVDARSGIWYLQVVARLKPGVTIGQARADLSLIDNHALPLLPKFFARYTQNVELTVIFLHEYMTGSIRDSLWLLMMAVFFILLIACANIGNLQLARGTVRSREFAMRATLGASRFRLARQLLTESILLSALGGFAGLLLGIWGAALLRSFLPLGLLNTPNVPIEATSLAFTFAASVLTGVLSGLVPMLALMNPNLNHALQSGRTQIAGSRNNARLRNLLAAGEVAAAVVLLVAAGLLLNSFLRLKKVNSGFDPHNLLSAQLFLPSDRYSTPSQQAIFAAELLEHIKAIPGVRAASISTSLPILLQRNMRVGIEGRPSPASNDLASFVPLDSVSDEYFHTLGIPILSGREFDSRDGLKAPQVAIVNEQFVQSFFPDHEDPIGKRILLGVGSPDQTPATIIGICTAIRRTETGGRSLPQIFLPFAQSPTSDMTVLLRTAFNPNRFAPALRLQVLAIDKALPLANVATVEDLLAEEIARQRLETIAVGLFAVLALLLAGIGIYGVISYVVGRRTQEIGIRIALGARRLDVLRVVMRDGALVMAGGMIVGIAGALALTRLLRSMLFHVSPTDCATYMAVIAIFAVVALAACYVPSRRAMKVDPLVALRNE